MRQLGVLKALLTIWVLEIYLLGLGLLNGNFLIALNVVQVQRKWRKATARTIAYFQKEQFLSTASKDYLDNLGALHGLSKHNGENEEHFRERILMAIRGTNRGNNPVHYKSFEV